MDIQPQKEVSTPGAAAKFALAMTLVIGGGGPLVRSANIAVRDTFAKDASSLKANGDFKRAADCDLLHKQSPGSQCTPAQQESQRQVNAHRENKRITNISRALITRLSAHP
jgi:hypothetical protein